MLSLLARGLFQRTTQQTAPTAQASMLLRGLSTKPNKTAKLKAKLKAKQKKRRARVANN
ncbi:hypothetical protein DFQ28_005272 [Apophysomyces sp. BC1034]|nr:hypothetical protein DFQ30_003437 [Apophysomyces sp. BC1015]KAG0182802.1 hypothetical protein DFQ29_001967 [Apophysomyces sp. BC1021]KAG0193454.1 hypothetical protein DFQ28_005272 [Apophysomyces sp. BC1034]